MTKILTNKKKEVWITASNFYTTDGNWTTQYTIWGISNGTDLIYSTAELKGLRDSIYNLLHNAGSEVETQDGDWYLTEFVNYYPEGTKETTYQINDTDNNGSILISLSVLYDVYDCIGSILNGEAEEIEETETEEGGTENE